MKQVVQDVILIGRHTKASDVNAHFREQPSGKDIAKVSHGPATRRGLLDKEGAEVVGGVVVARYGANPMEVINNVKEKINELSSGLPSKTLSDGRTSQLTVVPFYDRTELIQETLGTLNEALTLELKEMIVDELIEFGRLTWTKKFGKRIVEMVQNNYDAFVQKENWRDSLWYRLVTTWRLC